MSEATSALPARQIGGFANLLAALDHAAAFHELGHTWFQGSGKQEAALSYAQLQQQSDACAERLRQAAPGLQPGARVGIVAATGPWFLATFCACLRLGLVPCPLPMPAPLQDMGRYRQHLLQLQQAAGMGLIMAPQALLPLLQPGLALSLLALEGDLPAEPLPASQQHSASPQQRINAADCAPDSIAYLQFSSGSTAQPKGIAISHRALMANVDAILRHGMRLNAADRAFSWLPYYHDMGLVGFVLAPLCAQVPVDYLAPSAFARRPALWPSLLSQRASTVCYAPGFAWQLAARHSAAVPADADLSALRIAGVGGDYVDAEALQAFANAYAAHGFDPQAFKPSYGLAEATLAVAINHAPYRSLARHALVQANGQVQLLPEASAETRVLVGCGGPLPDWQLQIQSADGQVLPALHEGEIVLQGSAQLSGTYQQGTLQAWPAGAPLRTGDLGFVDGDGCLYITGRIKDLLVINGRNLWPQDVEAAVHQTHAVAAEHLLLLQDARPGKNLALVLLVHEKGLRKSLAGTEVDDAHLAAALQALAHTATAAAGSAVHVCMVANSSISTTSSGKMARQPTRLRFEAGQIRILASTSSAYAATPNL